MPPEIYNPCIWDVSPADASYKDLLHILESWLTGFENESERKFATQDLHRIWGGGFYDSNVLPTLSTVSALDLFLTVNKYPPGSEIIMTALTTSPIISLMSLHEIVPIPCDIDVDSLSPNPDDLRALINDRTSAVVITNSMGRRVNMNPIIKLCKHLGVHVIEDCSEGFSGMHYTGHMESDISVFGFDATKHCTAFGGALAKVKQRDVYLKMREIHDSYPLQSRTSYAYDILKHLPELSKVGSWIYRLSMLATKIYKPKTNSYPEPLKDTGALPSQIRQKPCLALLRAMSIRLGTFNDSEHDRLVEKGNYVFRHLPEMAQGVGSEAYYAGYWMYPIVVDKPDAVVEMLKGCNIPAARNCIDFKIVGDRTGSGYTPQNARFILDHMVYLPIHKGLSYDDLDQIVFALEKAVIIKRCDKLPMQQIRSRTAQQI